MSGFLKAPAIGLLLGFSALGLAACSSSGDASVASPSSPPNAARCLPVDKEWRSLLSDGTEASGPIRPTKSAAVRSSASGYWMIALEFPDPQDGSIQQAVWATDSNPSKPQKPGQGGNLYAASPNALAYGDWPDAYEFEGRSFDSTTDGVSAAVTCLGAQ